METEDEDGAAEMTNSCSWPSAMTRMMRGLLSPRLWGGAVSWMGGVELGKSFLGKDSLMAWAAGAVIPGGIFGIWRRALHSFTRPSHSLHFTN